MVDNWHLQAITSWRCLALSKIKNTALKYFVANVQQHCPSDKRLFVPSGHLLRLGSFVFVDVFVLDVKNKSVAF